MDDEDDEEGEERGGQAMDSRPGMYQRCTRRRITQRSLLIWNQVLERLGLT